MLLDLHGQNIVRARNTTVNSNYRQAVFVSATGKAVYQSVKNRLI